jgi:signal transduction histidine kinase
MIGLRPNPKPRFLWRAILIVLPVVILASVGALSLRQDRLLAEKEADELAGQLADAFLPEVAEVIAARFASALAAAQAPHASVEEANQTIAFQINAEGDLLHPPRLSDPLPQPLNPAELDPEQGELWQSARVAQFMDGATEPALVAYRTFLDAKPPARFAAAAAMSLAVLNAELGRYEEAVNALSFVIQEQADVALESGLPARVLASLRLIEFAQRDRVDPGPDVEWLEQVCSDAVQVPTWISRPLLDAAVELSEGAQVQPRTMREWLELWILHERARQLHRDFLRVRSQNLTIGGVAVPGPGSTVVNCQILRSDPKGDGDYWVVCLPERVLENLLKEWLRDTRGVPAYLGLGVTLASREYRIRQVSHAGADRWQLSTSTEHDSTESADSVAPIHEEGIRLAQGSTTHPELGELEMSVYLDDPVLLFARQRTRTLWFGSLIGVASCAALVGLVTTWRAFDRQQRLADLQSRFVSSVSHELRAPIGSIRLLADGLESGRITAPEKQAEYFGLIGQECRRLTALIENVLDFSRIDQGRKHYEFEPTDIVALVRQTVRLMEPQATDRQVTLTLELPNRTSTSESQTSASDLPPLDGHAIQQAMVNLIDNAIKHAPSGSNVEVGLALDPHSEMSMSNSASTEAAARPGLRMWVRDQGEGIPPVEHERIFEPFYRRGSELRRETPGIGIGLSLVKHIVEAHRGRVTVESDPGRGSSFVIHIP